MDNTKCEFYVGSELVRAGRHQYWEEKCSHEADGICLGRNCPKLEMEAAEQCFQGITVNGKPLAEMLTAQGGD